MPIDFHKLQAPYLHIVLTDEKTFGEYAYRVNFAESSLAVRVVRGKKMRRRESLFDEFSAAFQFPHYFGENWDALDECLADLRWLPANGYALLVVNTIDVLSQERSDQFEIFAQVLSDIPVEWAKAQTTPKPFHIVFQCSSGELDRLQQRFQSARVDTSLETLSTDDPDEPGTSRKMGTA